MTTDERAALDAVTGALVGVHAGDALGASVEFESWAAIGTTHPNGHRDIVGGGPFRWRPGAATDDTDLTLAVAQGYMAHLATGSDLLRSVADRMACWWEGDWPGRRKGTYPKDVGAATARGLRSYRHHGDPTCSGAGQGRAGNGSLMRCIATGIVRIDASRRRVESIAISSVTHDDGRCTAACASYNDAVAALVDGASPSAAVDAARRTAAELANSDVERAIDLGLTLDLGAMAATGHNPLPDHGRGFVLDSLSLAVASLVDERSFEEVIVDVVRLGGDTDTNAAIAGGLRGSHDGISAIPTRWVERLQFRDELRELGALLTSWR